MAEPFARRSRVEILAQGISVGNKISSRYKSRSQDVVQSFQWESTLSLIVSNLVHMGRQSRVQVARKAMRCNYAVNLNTTGFIPPPKRPKSVLLS